MPFLVAIDGGKKGIDKDRNRTGAEKLNKGKKTGSCLLDLETVFRCGKVLRKGERGSVWVKDQEIIRGVGKQLGGGEEKLKVAADGAGFSCPFEKKMRQNRAKMGKNH